VIVMAVVLAAGTAQAQVILDQSNVLIEVGGTQTARLSSGGDLYLGGDGMYGDIISYKGTEGAVFYWNAGSADLTIGGATSGTPLDGHVYLKDNDGVTTTIELRGQYGDIILGGSGSNEDGDLTIRDNDGSSSIILDGASGNATNQLGGNGLIKAWARINSNGTVASCWRCNTNASYTFNSSPGYYYVDFNFTTDITSRPLSAVIDSHSVGSITHGNIQLGYRSGDSSAVWVRTSSETGTAGNRPFTLFVY